MQISAVTIKIIQAISTLNSSLCSFNATKMVMALIIAVMPIIFHNPVSPYIRFILYYLPEKLKLFLLANGNYLLLYVSCNALLFPCNGVYNICNLSIANALFLCWNKSVICYCELLLSINIDVRVICQYFRWAVN